MSDSAGLWLYVLALVAAAAVGSLIGNWMWNHPPKDKRLNDGCQCPSDRDSTGRIRINPACPTHGGSPTTSQVASHGGDSPQRGIGGQGRAGTSPAVLNDGRDDG